MSKSRRERRAAERQAAKASVASGSGAASQGSGDSRESPSERTREGDRVSVGDFAGSPQEESLDGHARLRARAREELGPGASSLDLKLFLGKLHDEGLWVSGETPHVLAGSIIGPRGKPLTAETIQNYSCHADDLRKALADKDRLREIVFSETLKSLDRATKWLDVFDETVEGWRGDDGKIYFDAKGLKETSEAAKQLSDIVSDCVDKLARFAGLLQPTQVQTTVVEINGSKLSMHKDQADMLAFLNEEERRTPGIRERFLAFKGVDVFVPMLPGGG